MSGRGPLVRRVATVAGGIVGLAAATGLGGWLYLRAPDLPAATLQARYGRPNSHYVDLPGGIRVHYLDSGPKAGPAIVLLHGFGDNGFSWDGWTEALAATHRVIALDLPGHGLTAAPVDYRASYTGYADLVDAVATRIGVTRLAVAGNSMGGGVAWTLALRHPARVSHLILVDAAGWPREGPAQDVPLAFRLMRYRWGRALLASIDNTPLIRTGLKLDVVDQRVLTEPFIRRWADLQRLPGHRPILMSVDPGRAAATDAALAAIRVPTLILWGAADRLIPVAAAHRFQVAIPQAELIVYPDVGHLPQWEIPARSGADAAAFLARHKEG
ncbi:alpha/beta fold hydrolase [Sphingomonas sp. M6A6_1c]